MDEMEILNRYSGRIGSVCMLIGRTKIAPYFHICNSKNTIRKKSPPYGRDLYSEN
jgi:hypothetical protein